MEEIKNQEVNEENTSPQMEEVTDESFAPNDKMAEDLTLWQDKYVRLSAEFDNYRKRTVKEKMELIENAGEDVIKSILPILDDFERALQHFSEGVDKDGVNLIYNKLLSTLAARGVKAMESMGQPFDVESQEAVAKFAVEDSAKKGTVIDVAQKGYMYKNKVLRFAKVVVGE